jgi:uncharacterized protein YacL
LGAAVSLLFLGLERIMVKSSLRGFTHAIFGFGIGIFCAWLLTRASFLSIITTSFGDAFSDDSGGKVFKNAIFLAYRTVLFVSFGFLGTVLALRGNRDDFAFVIPYVRFRQEGSSIHPIVLDADMLMDGRLLRLLSSGFITGRIIIAKFILEEIEAIAKSETDPLKQRAQRSLKNLLHIQAISHLEVSFHDSKTDSETHSSQDRLIELSQIYNANILTNDSSLATYAKLQGISVLNLNDLQEALQQTVAIGERLQISLSRPGKEEHQGVGYLSDGSMVVVNQGASSIGSNVDCVVITTLETSNGLLVFADKI